MFPGDTVITEDAKNSDIKKESGRRLKASFVNWNASQLKLVKWAGWRLCQNK